MNFFDTETIDKYLKGQLEETERIAFDAALKKDTILQKNVRLHEEMIQGIHHHVRLKLKSILQNKEKKIIQKQQAEEKTYTLEELLEMFTPVSHYEHFIHETEVVSRSENLEVIVPENGIDASVEQIIFAFNNPLKKEAYVLVENNQEDELMSITLLPGVDYFRLDTRGFEPGRYYWKLTGADVDIMMGYFFIRKDLLPKI